MRRLVALLTVAVLPLLLPQSAPAAQSGPTANATDEPKAAVEAFFDAHTRGDLKAIESMYVPAATVSMTAPGPGGAPAILSLPVKQYVGWYQGQFASRTAMRFVVGQMVVHREGGFATTWIPLEVHETMKDGSRTIVRAVASLHLFREGAAWKITAHAWQAVSN